MKITGLCFENGCDVDIDNCQNKNAMLPSGMVLIWSLTTSLERWPIRKLIFWQANCQQQKQNEIVGEVYYDDLIRISFCVHNIRNRFFGLVTCSTASLTVSKRENRARVRVNSVPVSKSLTLLWSSWTGQTVWGPQDEVDRPHWRLSQASKSCSSGGQPQNLLIWRYTVFHLLEVFSLV